MIAPVVRSVDAGMLVEAAVLDREHRLAMRGGIAPAAPCGASRALLISAVSSGASRSGESSVGLRPVFSMAWRALDAVGLERSAAGPCPPRTTGHHARTSLSVLPACRRRGG